MSNLTPWEALSDIANNLINRLAEAVGWIVTHPTPKRIAEDTYIEEIRNSNLNPITKAAAISSARKTIKEYSNQKNIVQHALSQLRDDANPHNVSDDWYLQFMDKARLISDSELQIIWGHILAEEVNSPGTVSKKLLHNLSLMSNSDAENFLNISRFCFWDKKDRITHPILYIKEHSGHYADYNITTSILNELSSFSLLETNYDTGFAFSKKKLLIYQNHMLELKADRIPVGNIRFTPDGQKLFNIITKHNNYKILEFTIEVLRDKGCSVNIIDN